MRALSEEKEKICGRFDFPENAAYLIDFFFDDRQRDLILHAPDTFTEADYEPGFVRQCYRDGLVSYADYDRGIFQLSNFYNMFDVFICAHQDHYNQLTRHEKGTLDTWYFDRYYDSLKGEVPTPDRILSLEDTLRFVDEHEETIYLNPCDCRSLTGDCGHSRSTCLSYRGGPNSFADRGISKTLTKEEAKEMIIAADREGLMHTVNPSGVCNCCSDCCYLFRSQKRRDSLGVWPATETIIKLDADKCVGCGKCARRCHFSVFTLNREIRKVSADVSTCVGCGICQTQCPSGALTLVPRPERAVS